MIFDGLGGSALLGIVVLLGALLALGVFALLSQPFLSGRKCIGGCCSLSSSGGRVAPHRPSNLAAEEVEALCARTGFTPQEVVRLYADFEQASGGAPTVEIEKFLAGLDQFNGPLLPRLPAALRIAPGRQVDFGAAVAALGALCERAPKDDKVRLFYRLFDRDGDGRLSRSDLRSTLELILPRCRDAGERKELLDRAVEGTFQEIAGRGDPDCFGLEQFALIASEFADEQVTAFF